MQREGERGQRTPENSDGSFDLERERESAELTVQRTTGFRYPVNMASSLELEEPVGLLEGKPKQMSLFDSDEEDCHSDVERYFEEVKASDGFDVVTEPRCELMGAVTPIHNLEEDTVLFNRTKILSALAILHYNKEHNANYNFWKVVKLNTAVVSGAIFYITFEAKDAVNGEVKVFQAKVWRGIGFNEVMSCRLKPTD